MRRPLRACTVIAALLLLAAACTDRTPSSATPSPDAAVPSVTPVSFPTTLLRAHTDAGDVALHIEVASTPAQSERGLGYRDTLAQDAGMLFDLHSTRRQEFWMKGMRFPLDFVWIGDDKRVVAITPDVPAEPGTADADLRRYAPPIPVRYVLEINAGAAARLDIGPGTQLQFELPLAQ